MLSDAIRDPVALCRSLGLPGSLADDAHAAAGGFPLLVPQPYLSRIVRGDAADPLLRQVLPRSEECAAVDGFAADPLQEAAFTTTDGLLSRYPRRVLLVAAATCGVHCRYCFRRHFPYAEHCRPSSASDAAFHAIAADVSIDEVILSGGDPLALDDQELAELIERLAAIRHLRRIRIHTRLPIVIPQRVTSALVDALRGTRLTPIVVVQSNHPAELDDLVAAALGRLIDAGIPLLNQAVLLRGVNDRAGTLAELCRRLVDLRVMPYYLHQLDRVAGAAHFEVPVAEGVQLMEELRAGLPGYAVPRYVRERPGRPAKQSLC